MKAFHVWNKKGEQNRNYKYLLSRREVDASSSHLEKKEQLQKGVCEMQRGGVLIEKQYYLKK